MINLLLLLLKIWNLSFYRITGDDLLNTFIEGKSIRTERAIRDIFNQVCSFLQYIHGQGYVHLGLNVSHPAFPIKHLPSSRD